MIIGKMYEAHADVIRTLEPYKTLEQRLQTFGGRELVFTPVDPVLLVAILEHGRLFDTTGIRQRKGEPSNCHENVTSQWKRHQSTYRIVHGYGLNNGLWRNHSWLLDAQNRIIETTVLREKYYGTVLEGALQAWFIAQ